MKHNTTQHNTELKASSSLSFHSLFAVSLLNSFSHFFFSFSYFFSGSLFSLKLTRSEKWDLILELSGGRLMPINLLNSTGVKGAAAASAAAATLTGNRPRRSSRRHSNCVIYVCKDVRFKIEKLKKNNPKKRWRWRWEASSGATKESHTSRLTTSTTQLVAEITETQESGPNKMATSWWNKVIYWLIRCSALEQPTRFLPRDWPANHC